MAKKLKLYCNIELAMRLAEKFEGYVPFNTKGFLDGLEKELNALELRGRVYLMADRIHSAFGRELNPEARLDAVQSILGPPLEGEEGMFNYGYWLMPVAAYLERHCLATPEKTLEVMAELTKRHTGEYCIRPFIEEHYDYTMSKISEWSNSPNVHVRRLASEGIRPRLPWARKLERFINNPQPVLEILESYEHELSSFVCTSVGNNLGDIVKDNLDAVLPLLEKWLQSSAPKARWMVRHAVRTPRKKGVDWAIDIHTRSLSG